MIKTGLKELQCNNELLGPSLCNTQRYFDRDVEFLLCDEARDCQYKRYYNRMKICDCPAIKTLSN